MKISKRKWMPISKDFRMREMREYVEKLFYDILNEIK